MIKKLKKFKSLIKLNYIYDSKMNKFNIFFNIYLY